MMVVFTAGTPAPIYLYGDFYYDSFKAFLFESVGSRIFYEMNRDRKLRMNLVLPPEAK